MIFSRSVCACIILFGLSTPLNAVEPVLEFLEGLRQKGYYDTALDYLDRVEQNNQLDPEIRKVLPYERAQTLLSSARLVRTLEGQREQLDAAQASFEQFVKSAPNHPLAGQANTERGRILLEKARVEIFDANKPSNESSREVFRENARDLIAQAKVIFQQAAAQHEKTHKSFPTSISERDEPERYQSRADAESRLIYAKFDLANCTYWEGQTHDDGSTEKKRLLTKAADVFEKIYEEKRQQAAGQFARMMQGKSYEEQGEIGIALGIYEHFLSNPGNSELVRNLRDMALHFRLICLNHEQREDYKLVVIEAEDWLKTAKSRSRTDRGRGIQWELCRALEQLGADRSISESMQRNHLTEALNRARTIARYPGELKTKAAAMIQRLMVALDRDPSDPEDFDSAYVAAGQIWEEVTSLTLEINQAKGAGDLEKALEKNNTKIAIAGEMVRLYDMALKFVTPDNDPVMVNIAAVRLAYGYLLQEKYFDAAAVAQFYMDKTGDRFPENAREAGFIAMSAFDAAYSEADKNDREFEAAMVTNIAEKLASRWPDSGRANDARHAVAKIHFYSDDLLEAAKWWEQIPEGASDYPNAQIRAGKAYWRHYSTEAAKPDDERASAEELQSWKKAALERFVNGIKQAEKAIPDDKPLPDDVVGAKISLASIRNMDGVYTTADGSPTGALELLTEGPHSVLKSVEVSEGEERPNDPTAAKSRQMASLAYQQLLRTQIGLKNLDEAKVAREKLESLAGSEDAAALTQIFVDFGRELQQELDRLKASGETERLAEVRDGFEGFLTDLSNREDGQTYYSMRWIAETLTSLGDASRENPQKAQQFFTKAADIYQQIISKANNDPQFVGDSDQVLSTKLRLVSTLRRKPDFAGAEKVILDILSQSPNAPDAQFEAARLYQDWGAEGGPDAMEHFRIAIAGKDEPAKVWGWAYTAQALQRALYGKKDERLSNLHFDARYNLAAAEFEFGKAHPDNEKSLEHLRRAQGAIAGFQRVSNRWPDAEYARFNSLYRDVLSSLGSPVVDLPREITRSNPSTTPGSSTSSQVAQSNQENTPETAETNESGGSPLLILLMLIVGGGAVAGLYYVAVGQNKRKYAKYKTSGSKTPKAPKAEEPVAQLDFGNVNVTEPTDIPVIPDLGVEAAPSFTSAPTKTKKKSATKSAPEKKKRKLTEEEIKKIKAARAAKAAKQKTSGTSETPKKKRRPKPPSDG